jgi:hypothetical protein
VDQNQVNPSDAGQPKAYHQEIYKHMKHLHTFSHHINESQSEPYKVGKREFVISVMNAVPQRSEPFTSEEGEKLHALYSYLDPTGKGEWVHKQNSTYDRRFKITDSINQTHRMSLWIGKNTDGTWSLQNAEVKEDAYSWTDAFFIFPSMQDAIGFISAKYGPKIKWEKIK